MIAGPVARYEVSHPEYGVTCVDAISPETAINAALKKWGGSWKQDAGYCHAVWLGTAQRPRCRRCHNEYGQPGDPTAYCQECLDILARRQREADRYAIGAAERAKRLRDMEA